MPRKSYAIKSDGKNFTFIPGKDGSLISTETENPTGLEVLGKTVAKTIASPELNQQDAINNFQARKRREGIVKTLSVRG